MTREQYIQNQTIIRNRMIKQFTTPVYQALQSQINGAVALIRDKGIRGAQGNIHSFINPEIEKVITDIYRTATKQAIKKYHVNRKAAFGFMQDFVDEVIGFFARYLLDKVVLPISQTTIDFIEGVLQDAIANGWGVDQTVKQLENSDVTKNRARMIVRTETVRATNFAQLAAADNEDFEVQKQWLAVEDRRTRATHSHLGVDGQVRDLYEPFSNGLMFPGDPMGSASETINCRCTMSYAMKRDLNGKLIPKENPGFNLASRLNL